MEEYIKNLKFRTASPLSSNEIQSLSLLLNSKPGISNTNYANTLISLDYNSYLISEENIIKLININGIVFSSPKKPGLFNRWLQKLEKSNKENFGDQRLGCCNLNEVVKS